MAEPITRNTRLLTEILDVISEMLTDKDAALARLEEYFSDQYILSAGNTEYISTTAESLRLALTKDECPLVLDYIAQKSMVGITVDHVETAINELFDNRFIEP